MEVFTVFRNDILDRFDPIYFLLQKKVLGACNYEKYKISALCSVRDGDHNKLPMRYITTKENGIRYLRAQDLRDGEIDSTNPIYISREYYNTIPRSHIKPGYFLFSIMATIGSIAVVPDDFNECTANRAIGFLVIKNTKKLNAYYLFSFFSINAGTSLLESIKKGGLQQRINLMDVANLEIPIPPMAIQQKIIQIMDEAYSKKKHNEEEAERLLNSYTELINEFIDIDLNSSTQRKIFSIYFEELEGALNPERYANRLILDSKHSWIQIKDIGDIIRDTFTPSRTNPEDHYGLIRIDDLDNNPQDAVIRDVKGNDINGIILKVQKDDILVARLGPTLENKKTIITPSYGKELIASNEFICLRCREKVNPVFVLVFLKTDFYKNLMIQKSRGATPSRRRLSHEDFAELPFPDIAKTLQDNIADKFIENANRAMVLKKEAVESLEQAKKEVEKILYE